MTVTPNARTSRTLTWLSQAGFITIVALAGMLNIPFPFSGDQALFTLGARSLARGAFLYRDFWDLKQPGIYWFYRAAGAVFGYNEIGIHIAELIWFIALAIVLSVSLRKRFGIGWISDLCAVMTVGVYFAVCGTWHLTQLEGLVSLPLFLALLAIIPQTPAKIPTARLIAFGMLAAVVALFKLLLIAIPIGFFIVSIFPDAKNDLASAGRRLFRGGLIAVGGWLIIIIPVVIHFAMQHQLPLVYKTFFIYPPRIATELPMNGVVMLRRSGVWFVRAAGPLLPLAAIGACCRLRNKPDRFTLAILTWILLAGLLVLMQRLWWEYHFLLILFPVGILAAFGLEDVVLWLHARPWPAKKALLGLLLMLLLCPFAARLLRKAANEARSPNRTAFDAQESLTYAAALDESKWLAAKPPGEIYVLGDPLIYYLSGRQQPIPLNGWSPEWLLPEQWAELANQLQTAQPRYVFTSAYSQPLVTTRGSELMRVINDNYRFAHADDNGTWYTLNAPLIR